MNMTANGNLIKRKRGARSGNRLTATDALNRNTTVDYNLGASDASPTAAVRRYYDMATTGDGGGSIPQRKRQVAARGLA